MVRRCIDQITRIIVENLTARYIQMPISQEMRELTKNKFAAKFGIPGILGIIDATHVTLNASNVLPSCVNREGNPSINAQIVCDSDMIITSANARFPGSVEDDYIFNNSQLFIFLRDLHDNQPNEWNFLIGIIMHI